MRRPLPLALVLALLAVLGGLGACGEEGDGGGAGRPTREGLLEALVRRVEGGEGISDATWTDEVTDVALALWPSVSDAGDLAARRDHANLAHIAGDMAVQLAREQDAREAWLEHDPISVRIHDGFVQAAGRGVEAYRRWVGGDGRALLRERQAALMAGDPPR